MKKLLMCRVCLIEDNRSKSIVGTHLQEMYESLVLMPFETADGRPLLVCYICRARLQNCYELRKSCLESEELFTQMLKCNEYEQVKLQAINNKKRLTIHNTVEWILGMDVNNIGVEALYCEVKNEPNDDEDVDNTVLKEKCVSDNVQSVDLDDDFLIKVKEEQIGYRTNIDRDDVGASSVPDDLLPADSDTKNEENMGHELEMDADSDGAETLVLLCDVKDEQSDAEGAYTPKEPSKSVQWSSEGTTSSNLNEHNLVQDKFEKLNEVTAVEITNENKEITASVQNTCDTCQQCYSSKRELERHVSLCTDEWKKDLSCMNVTNHARNHLKTHMRTHSDEKPHCHICKKQFSHKGHFVRHMRTHTSEKLYYCEICKKQFSKKNNLTKHMRTHSSKKPYHCNVCDKQFLQKSNLIIHMRTHTGEKPYHCDICEKQFSQKIHLTAHRRTHTGEKPFHCDTCKKQFSEKSYLNIHMRQHTGEKPYHCDICNKHFSLKRSLNTHMRLHTSVICYLFRSAE